MRIRHSLSIPFFNKMIRPVTVFSIIAFSLIVAPCAFGEEPISFRLLAVKKLGEAEELHKRLEAGDYFWKLAMDRSLAPNADLGGYVEAASTEELREEFLDALKKLDPGEISPIIDLGGQYAILKRERTRPSEGVWDIAEASYRELLDDAIRGDFKTAGKKALETLEIYPNHISTQFALGVIERAIDKELKKGLAEKILSAVKSIHEKDHEKAMRILDQVSKKAKDSPEIRIARGSVLISMKKVPEAVSQFQQALTSRFGHLANMYLGAAYLQTGDFQKALSHYQTAVAGDINLAQAHLGLGLVYMAMGKADDAMKEIYVSLAIDPNLDSAYNQMGILLLAARKIPEAVWALEKAVTIRPNHAPYLAHLGFAYNRWGIFSKSLDVLKKALEIAPDDPLIHNNLAIAYYDSGQIDKAIEHTERAVALGYKVHPDFLAKLENYK